MEDIRESIIQAYYTPNVQFEVLLGALLRPYLAAIVNAQCGIRARHVASEFPFWDKDPGNTLGGAKIDFLLADAHHAYWVELKTVFGLEIQKDGDARAQYHRYRQSLEKYRTFGAACGDKLIDILKAKYKRLNRINAPYDMEKLKEIFRLITGERECASYAEAAMRDMKKTGRASSFKYLLTLGQLLDYFRDGIDPLDFWARELKLIYVTPTGKEMEPDKDDPFYLAPLEGSSVSLLASAPQLRDKGIGILADVINALYG